MALTTVVNESAPLDEIKRDQSFENVLQSTSPLMIAFNNKTNAKEGSEELPLTPRRKLSGQQINWYKSETDIHFEKQLKLEKEKHQWLQEEEQKAKKQQSIKQAEAWKRYQDTYGIKPPFKAVYMDLKFLKEQEDEIVKYEDLAACAIGEYYTPVTGLVSICFKTCEVGGTGCMCRVTDSEKLAQVSEWFEANPGMLRVDKKIFKIALEGGSTHVFDSCRESERMKCSDTGKGCAIGMQNFEIEMPSKEKKKPTETDWSNIEPEKNKENRGQY